MVGHRVYQGCKISGLALCGRLDGTAAYSAREPGGIAPHDLAAMPNAGLCRTRWAAALQQAGDNKTTIVRAFHVDGDPHDLVHWRTGEAKLKNEGDRLSLFFYLPVCLAGKILQPRRLSESSELIVMERVITGRPARRSDFRRWLLLAGCFWGILFVLYVFAIATTFRERRRSFLANRPHRGFLSRAQFGRKLILLGPWGFVFDARGNPGIYPWVFWSRLLLATSFTAGAAQLALWRIPNGIGRWAWMAAVIFLAQPMYMAPALLFVARRIEINAAGRA